MARLTRTEREEIIELLKEDLKPGDTIFGILRGRTQGGTNYISFHTIEQGVSPMDSTKPLLLHFLYFSYNFSRLLKYRYNDKLNAVAIRWDTGFEFVRELGRVLYQDPNAFHYRNI